MKHIFPILFLALFASCKIDFQYNVYMDNKTGEDLFVTVDSDYARDGVHKKTVRVTPKDRFLILVSSDMNPDQSKTVQEDHFKHVLKDLKIVSSKGKRLLKKDWRSLNTRFFHSDIQQGEFTIEVRDEDF